ncbi:MAG TPA: hypothetical protein ENO21_04795 [Firmicutes bacterium]|nr:hypothetical protein [Bacillota bacterium]
MALRLILSASLLLLGACARPHYWVEGLDLPPGSKVVSQVETQAPREVPGIALPMMGEFSNSLTVSFDNLTGWDAVSSNLDRRMQELGYSRGFGDLDEMISSITGTSAVASGFSSYLRVYTKEGGRFMVVLYDVTEAAAAQGSSAAGGAAADGTGEYVLQVMRFK